MGFNEASLMLKISLVMVGLGMLFHLIGFASEYWTSYDVGFYTSHYGLWSFGSGKKASKYRSTCFCVFFVFLFIYFVHYLFVYECMSACVRLRASVCACVCACVRACVRVCVCVLGFGVCVPT